MDYRWRKREGATTLTAAFGSAYARLSRSNAALLLIDHQVGPLWELEFGESRRRAGELARVARRLGLPTIITAMDPEEFGPVIPELTTAHPEAPIIVRTAVNAWEAAEVRGAVEATGRTKLIVAGSTVDVGVALCALAASGAGYDIYAPIDACGQASHRALIRLSREGVIVTTASLVARELTEDGATQRSIA